MYKPDNLFDWVMDSSKNEAEYIPMSVSAVERVRLMAMTPNTTVGTRSVPTDTLVDVSSSSESVYSVDRTVYQSEGEFDDVDPDVYDTEDEVKQALKQNAKIATSQEGAKENETSSEEEMDVSSSHENAKVAASQETAATNATSLESEHANPTPLLMQGVDGVTTRRGSNKPLEQNVPRADQEQTGRDFGGARQRVPIPWSLVDNPLGMIDNRVINPLPKTGQKGLSDLDDSIKEFRELLKSSLASHARSGIDSVPESLGEAMERNWVAAGRQLPISSTPKPGSEQPRAGIGSVREPSDIIEENRSRSEWEESDALKYESISANDNSLAMRKAQEEEDRRKALYYQNKEELLQERENNLLALRESQSNALISREEEIAKLNREVDRRSATVADLRAEANLANDRYVRLAEEMKTRTHLSRNTLPKKRVRVSERPPTIISDSDGSSSSSSTESDTAAKRRPLPGRPRRSSPPPYSELPNANAWEAPEPYRHLVAPSHVAEQVPNPSPPRPAPRRRGFDISQVRPLHHPVDRSVPSPVAAGMSTMQAIMSPQMSTMVDLNEEDRYTMENIAMCLRQLGFGDFVDRGPRGTEFGLSRPDTPPESPPRAAAPRQNMPRAPSLKRTTPVPAPRVVRKSEVMEKVKDQVVTIPVLREMLHQMEIYGLASVEALRPGPSTLTSTVTSTSVKTPVPAETPMSSGRVSSGGGSGGGGGGDDDDDDGNNNPSGNSGGGGGRRNAGTGGNQSATSASNTTIGSQTSFSSSSTQVRPYKRVGTLTFKDGDQDEYDNFRRSFLRQRLVFAFDNDCSIKELTLATGGGRASKVLERVPLAEANDFLNLVSALDEYYRPEGFKELLYARFQNRMKLPTETMLQYLNDLEFLFYEAMPNSPAGNIDIMAKQQFLRGIGTEFFKMAQSFIQDSGREIAKKLDYILSYQKRDSIVAFPKAICVASTSQTAQDQMEPVVGTIRSQPQEPNEVPALGTSQEGQKPYANNRNNNGGGRGKRDFGIQCEFCKKKGHQIGNCFKKRDEDRLQATADVFASKMAENFHKTIDESIAKQLKAIGGEFKLGSAPPTK